MTDDHTPEGRTAHECFELARIALDQAEQVVNRASTPLECAKAQASASIAIGWARLGDALANEPRELEPIRYTDASGRRGTYPNMPGDGRHECTRDLGQCDDCGARREDKPDHKHNPTTCSHVWVAPLDLCANGCGAGPFDDKGFPITGPCPVTCPETSA